MDPRKLRTEFGLDSRLEDQGCAYCGGGANSVDHVPSKVLLEDPFPINLPVVPACSDCNQGFSQDEEYLACFLECVLKGTTEPKHLNSKVQRTFDHSPKLARSIAESRYIGENGDVLWTPAMGRVENVVIKLARGHVLYDLSYVETETPTTIQCVPLIALRADDLANFENAGAEQHAGWPGEIGSRAFLRACGVPKFDNRGPWITVQSGRYRYAIDNGLVQIVIAEYLACLVEWA